MPVIALTFLFAWRYRASNTEATYDPDWHHSTQLEVVIWTVPLLIVIALGAMTWISTHTLDPYQAARPTRPQQADARRREAADGRGRRARLEMAVHLPRIRRRERERDGRASKRADRLQDHVLLRVEHLLRPALAGMIYAMPGMETKLHAVMNKEGEFTGLSGHYSGSGFSRMNFGFRSLAEPGLRRVGGEGQGRAERPSTARPISRSRSRARPSRSAITRRVENGLYDAILGMCVAPGQMCVGEMHHIDTKGGAAKDSEANRKRLDYDNRRLQSGDEPSGATFPASGRPPRGVVQPEGMMPRDQPWAAAASMSARPSPIRGRATRCRAPTGGPRRPS